jgi:two-component system, NarL family, response regulator DesR
VTRVLIAEDQHMIRSALVALLRLEDDLEVVSEVDRGDLVAGAAAEHRPDVAVLDIAMPGLDGLDAAVALRRVLPTCAVLVLTGLSDTRHVVRALDIEVDGFLRKDAPAEELVDAVRRVVRGQRFVDPALVSLAMRSSRSPLTPREADVLRVAADGGSTREIAAALSLSPATTRNYLSGAMIKLDARNRLDAVRIAREAGWL